jgi:hypothetical protein
MSVIASISELPVMVHDKLLLSNYVPPINMMFQPGLFTVTGVHPGNTQKHSFLGNIGNPPTLNGHAGNRGNASIGSRDTDLRYTPLNQEVILSRELMNSLTTNNTVVASIANAVAREVMAMEDMASRYLLGLEGFRTNDGSTLINPNSLFAEGQKAVKVVDPATATSFDQLKKMLIELVESVDTTMNPITDLALPMTLFRRLSGGSSTPVTAMSLLQSALDGITIHGFKFLNNPNLSAPSEIIAYNSASPHLQIINGYHPMIESEFDDQRQGRSAIHVVQLAASIGGMVFGEDEIFARQRITYQVA